MENVLETIGKRIAECRRSNGFTQDELANRLGVTPQALSKWETGVSSPDLSMLSALCNILNVSSDYLLGRNHKMITENGDELLQNEIWNNLRHGLEPLELIFGENFLPIFADNSYIDKIAELRLQLSKEGILMPILTVKDQLCIKSNEIMILSYQNVLYSEEIENINETTIEYVINKLGQIVRCKYDEIINIDILKDIAENLKIKYPALIEGVVPNIISYALLLEVLKAFLNRGNGMIYLPKIIEILQCEIIKNENISINEMVEKICNQLERKDNLWAVLGTRK